MKEQDAEPKKHCVIYLEPNEHGEPQSRLMDVMAYNRSDAWERFVDSFELPEQAKQCVISKIVMM